MGLTVKKIKISEFSQQIRDGEITDATSVTAFLLAMAKNMIPVSDSEQIL